MSDGKKLLISKRFSVLQIADSTVVCSAHFRKQDHAMAGYVKRACLELDSIPSILDLTVAKKIHKSPRKRLFNGSLEYSAI